MTDTTLNRFLAYGTNADRLAFTPVPPSPASGPPQLYVWYETDTGETYVYEGGGWHFETGGGNISTVNLDGNASHVLAGDGTWVVGATGTGNVSGPGASTDRAIATWNSTGGVLLRNNSAATIDASGNIATSGTIAGSNIGNITPINLDGNGSHVLLGNGTWGTAATGTGNVSGSGVVGNQTIAIYEDTTGTLIGPSKITLTVPVTGSTLTIDDGFTLHATGNATVIGTNSGGANPTATASDTAVNGTATTFMRSDGAPAIQKTSAAQFGLCKVDGSTITASGGVISAVLAAAYPPIRTQLTRNATQSIPGAAAWTSVSWDNSVIDTPGAFSIGTPTQMTTPSGYTKVQFNFYATWANSGTGTRYQRIDQNGTTIQAFIRAAANESSNSMFTRILPTTAGDVWTFLVAQTSGGSLNLSGSAVFAGPSYIEAFWIP